MQSELSLLDWFPSLLLVYGLWCLTPLSTIQCISVILWRSVLLIDDTGVPLENNRLFTIHYQIYHIMLYWVPIAMNGVRNHNFSSDRHWFLTSTTKIVSSNPLLKLVLSEYFILAPLRIISSKTHYYHMFFVHVIPLVESYPYVCFKTQLSLPHTITMCNYLCYT